MMVGVKKQTNKKQKQQFLTIINYRQKLSADPNTVETITERNMY